MPWLVLVVVEERDGCDALDPGGRSAARPGDRRRRRASCRRCARRGRGRTCRPRSSWPDVDAAFTEQPEAFVARLLCPRRLTEDTHYLRVPGAELRAGTSRRARAPGDRGRPAGARVVGATTRSIESSRVRSWRFRTARAPGDFESLVKRLTARTLKQRRRRARSRHRRPRLRALAARARNLVGFTRALGVPDALPVRPAAQASVSKRAAHDAERACSPPEPPCPTDAPPYDAQRDDPVVAPPAYGALPADLDEVPAAGAAPTAQAPTWLSQANLDPANRSAAGLGAEVVRNNQEALVATAWDQAAALRQVNRVLNRTRLALEVGQPAQAARRCARGRRAAPTHQPGACAAESAGMTLSLEGRLAQSALPDGLFSGAFRRRLRPGTTVACTARSASTSAATLTAELTQQFVNDPVASSPSPRSPCRRGSVFTEDEVAKSRLGGHRRDVAGSRRRLRDGDRKRYSPVSRRQARACRSKGALCSMGGTKINEEGDRPGSWHEPPRRAPRPRVVAAVDLGVTWRSWPRRCPTSSTQVVWGAADHRLCRARPRQARSRARCIRVRALADARPRAPGSEPVPSKMGSRPVYADPPTSCW